jgi:hypothetical protein
MAELEDFDFVDDKLDKGERVKKRKYGYLESDMNDFYDIEELSLTNLHDGTYVIDWTNGDGNFTTIKEFLQFQYENDLFRRVHIQDGKYAKPEKKKKKT